MAKLIDLSGHRFERLLVIAKGKAKYGTRAFWRCRCDCGNEIVVSAQSLRTGATKSCGCLSSEMTSLRNEKHGFAKKEKLYDVWKSMRQRCCNKRNKNYQNYGGRGISVCDEWKDYIVFRSWALGNGYRDGLSIDRVDVNGNYEPSNCRWASDLVQANNTRRNIAISINGISKTASEWEREKGLCGGTISKRIKRYGMSPEAAVLKPVQRLRKVVSKLPI